MFALGDRLLFLSHSLDYPIILMCVVLKLDCNEFSLLNSIFAHEFLLVYYYYYCFASVCFSVGLQSIESLCMHIVGLCMYIVIAQLLGLCSLKWCISEIAGVLEFICLSLSSCVYPKACSLHLSELLSG